MSLIVLQCTALPAWTYIKEHYDFGHGDGIHAFWTSCGYLALYCAVARLLTILAYKKISHLKR